MGLDHVPTGSNPLKTNHRIPKDSEPVNEADMRAARFVDRVLSTPMPTPRNYGYVPDTVCGDGDPADVW